MPSIDSWPSVQDSPSFLSAPQTFVSVCLVMHLFHVPPDGSIHPGDFPPMSSSTNFATLKSAIVSTCAQHEHENGNDCNYRCCLPFGKYLSVMICDTRLGNRSCDGSGDLSPTFSMFVCVCLHMFGHLTFFGNCI